MPVLFLFVNADLVQARFRDGYSIAFVDDYTALLVGPSAAAITERIQREILPLLVKWEKRSDAIFEPSKTAFIHFTRVRSSGRDCDLSMTFKDVTIQLEQDG